jgi:hypothetical protein
MSFSKVSLRSTIAFALLTAVAASNAGLQLTAVANEYVAEGIKHLQLTFRHDKQRVEYEPPQGWTFAGSSNQLRLTPPKKFAEATITVAELNKPQPIDANSIDLFAQQILSELPVGSQFSKIEEKTTNSVLVGGNESFGVTVSYQAMGEKFVRTVILANVRDAHLVFRLTAKKDDFPALYRDFKGSIMTLQWADEPDTSPNQPAAEKQIKTE